jgi:hypothetical protein
MNEASTAGPKKLIAHLLASQPVLYKKTVIDASAVYVFCAEVVGPKTGAY